MLQIYNSLTRKKEAFKPHEPGKVRMYVCGLTVYDYSHLGHARAMVIFDMVARYLRIRGYHVTYVRNITDIDDKIINRANENGEDISEVTARFIKAMHDDIAALGVERPDAEPRATEHTGQIIAMITKLMEKGYAYVADNGDVYYDVSRFVAYGKLSGKRPEELRAGARVAVEEAKDDPLDFVLWKAAKPNEPSWNSPWGPGRPGWHIECSAMATHCLGNHLDIHGGGQDLQFPHHENEIAQSEGATGEPFVNVWMHNGIVRMDDEKMSKSLGNFFTVREVLAKYRPEEVRYFILFSHYRSPLNYSKEQLDGAKAALTRLYTALRGLPGSSDKAERAYRDRFYAAMDDDFNTPAAISVLFDLAHEINRLSEHDPAKAGQLAATLRKLGGILGLLQDDPDVFLQGIGAVGGDSLRIETIERLIAQRDEARKHKAWAESDRIRDLLAEKGVVLEDSASGTTWRRN
ncbi:MAG: cysteine--tRNA ligase [Gammaproteobacteria bacterium]|nr:cysteine--tRNA ligase [Gammaproteobacteria bacterium]MCI0591734.1 cysteine--tRNA ligase [Gammaproteobacteria bacterium]